ncbi:MAG: hypothetical protein QW400_04255 [Candidatus Diapherotrites archaeon]
MPKIKAVFKGPLLRERMLLYERAKKGRLKTRGLKLSLDRAKNIHLSGLGAKYNVEIFDGQHNAKRLERRLKAAAKLKERIPVKNPALHYIKALRQLSLVEELERKTLNDLEVLGVRIGFREERGTLVPQVHVSQRTNRPMLATAYAITKKALERKEALFVGFDNIVLELSLSVRKSKSKEYREEVRAYRDDLIDRASVIYRIDIIWTALSKLIRKYGWTN